MILPYIVRNQETGKYVMCLRGEHFFTKYRKHATRFTYPQAAVVKGVMQRLCPGSIWQGWVDIAGGIP